MTVAMGLRVPNRELLKTDQEIPDQIWFKAADIAKTDSPGVNGLWNYIWFNNTGFPVQDVQSLIDMFEEDEMEGDPRFEDDALCDRFAEVITGDSKLLYDWLKSLQQISPELEVFIKFLDTATGDWIDGEEYTPPTVNTAQLMELFRQAIK
jgi:hypothetical protein